MIKRIALILAALWLASPAYGQAVTKLCFPTALTSNVTGRTSCQNVDINNPLPVNASVSLTASALNVTVTNTTAAPVFVSSSTGFGGTISGTLTVQNQAAGSNLNVLDTNSPAILAAIQAATPTGTNNIGTVVAGLAIQTASTPTISTNGYVSGNCLGGFNSLTMVNNAGGSGFVTNFLITTNGTAASSLTPSVTIYLFDSIPTGTCTDKGTLLLQTGDLDKLIGGTPTSVTVVIPTGMTQGNANATFSPPLPFIAGGSSGSGLKTIIYALVSGSSITFSNTSAIHVRAGAALN